MMLSVHFLRQTEPLVLKPLHDALDPRIRLTAGLELPEPPDYHVLVAGRPKRQHLQASPRLHTLVIPWAGLPDETRALLFEFPGIAVHNLHHNAIPTAEMAIALLMSASKLIVPMDRALRANDWRPRYEPNPSLLLAGKTVLILGYGAVGRHVARVCRGLGMEVLAVQRHAERGGDECAEEIHPLSALHDLLPRCHALLICLPHTRETTGLIGEAELSLLPEHAVLVNVGRGPIVNEAALYAALHNGSLYAAGLDVWYHYPADEDSRATTAPSAYPFGSLSNVVLSPHRAGGSLETEMLRMEHLAELLNAVARGGPVPNRVDLRAGY